MSSPLIFTYNYPGTSALDNIFLDASGSPLPGTSGARLLGLQSPNVTLQGVTLTIQFYYNDVTPLLGAKTSLVVENVTIIASSATNTVGTLSYVFQYQDRVPGDDPLVARGRIAQISSVVNAASGIFQSYLSGNVVIVYDNVTDGRTIYIFSTQSS